jgi:hypothetical protein
VGADSLARLAFAAARQIADSARRAYIYRVLNAVVGGVIGASEVNRQRTLVDSAPSLADSIAALRLLARSEAWRDTGFTAALETVATLETIAPPRIVATLLIELVGDNAYASQPEAPRMRMLQRAISISESMDSASADAIRSQAVSVMAVFNPRAAVGVAAGIRSPNLRERSMAAIVRRQIELDASGPLDTAAAMLSPPLMDSIYAAIVARHAATGNIPMATSTAGLIVKRSLWAGAISEIAAAARTGADTIALLAGLREALELLDPQGDYAILEKKTLPTMIRWGELDTIVAWARSKSGTDGAYARLATIGALLPCRGEYVVC